VNKTATKSVTQFTKCILLHVLLMYNCTSQLRENKQKLTIASWHKSIFDHKFRTD